MTLQDIEIPQSSCVGKFLSAPVISHVSEISNNQIDDEVVLKNFKLGSLEHDVSPSDLSKLEQLIVNHKSAFSFDDLDLGHVRDYEHRIDITDDVPIKKRYRKFP